MPEEAKDDPYDPKVRWVNPHRLDLMTFVGKDVFAIAHDIYIIFINYKTHTETVYVVNHQVKGDGVDAIAGHRSSMFAFAEKKKNPRIFIMTYPTFFVMAQINDMDVKRYKAICMMECDLIAGLTGFPNYMVSVWCWRTNHRLYSVDTLVNRRKQLFVASRTHMLICQYWGEGLNVWEVARCYKKCFMMRRPKEEVTGWDVSEPVLTGVCWTLEGQLYAIDSEGNLYSNLIKDQDPVINPFYYAQDRENWYAEVTATACDESRQQKTEDQKLKKKKNKSKSFKNTSFIMRKEAGHVRQVIKIIIHDLDGSHMGEIDTNPDSASVNVQYLVRSDYDDIISETEHLVNKIVKKLSSTS